MKRLRGVGIVCLALGVVILLSAIFATALGARVGALGVGRVWRHDWAVRGEANLQFPVQQPLVAHVLFQVAGKLFVVRPGEGVRRVMEQDAQAEAIGHSAARAVRERVQEPVDD